MHMESRRSRKAVENRSRTLNFVIRLNDREREMLDVVADREQLSASETVRWLIRRAFEQNAIPHGDMVLGSEAESTVRKKGGRRTG
jgi:hypothetical protein